ncbi:hypothetical protein [Nitrosococcus halophilus]|uniref:hypothetical protein n=1 Tax=Nitrosococcus halophilus TaxID=133539 RepID=UPI00059DEAEB|nr:hypothetical protein [Nitrosococcus halophilus]
MKKTVLTVFLLAVISPLTVAAQGVRHPLDPLTWQEYWTVLEVLRKAEYLDANTRFSMDQAFV